VLLQQQRVSNSKRPDFQRMMEAPVTLDRSANVAEVVPRKLCQRDLQSLPRSSEESDLTIGLGCETNEMPVPSLGLNSPSVFHC